jgi:Glyoxalase-like domain
MTPAPSRAAQAPVRKLDHIIYATPDLNLGIDTLEKLLGVRAMPGGQHPGHGTRNAFIRLGGRTFLEILGPDPDQPRLDRPRWLGIDSLRMPRLNGWAVAESNLDELLGKAVAAGVKLGAIHQGRRKNPDGAALSWRFTDPYTVVADGLVPFFIDWGDSPHPSQRGAEGVTLIGFRAEHPDPAAVQRMLSALELDLPVQAGPEAALIADLACPRGRVELR